MIEEREGEAGEIGIGRREKEERSKRREVKRKRKG